jgi:radical SAM superfamily enzyme YgiQ (UPF0313 family)
MRRNSIVITEPTDFTNTKSVGCYYIENAVRRAGYDILYVPFLELKNTNADIYLFSVHHVRDMFYFKYIPSFIKNKITIAGGHCMNNPFPFLHYFDLVCVGEGESWIIDVLNIAEKTNGKKEFLSEAALLEGSLTTDNMHCPVKKIYEKSIDDAPCYLNCSNEDGHKDTWYIEIGRGCKSKCNYCELGWTSKYREKSKDVIISQIDNIERKKSNRVNIFAPDDFSHTNYDDTLKHIIDNGLITNFGSMRYDNFEKIEKQHKKNFLFRIGLDGFSERVRDVINKKITNDEILNVICEMANRGFVMFKLFMIFSYEFETDSDFHQWLNFSKELNYRLSNLKRPIFLRVKFTPLIPNPLTPVEYFTPNYDIDRKKDIDKFFLEQKYAKKTNIVYINDGILEPFSYYSQAFLSRVDYEDFNPKMILDKKIHNFKSEELARTIKPRRHVTTCIDEQLRINAFGKMKQKIHNHYAL